MLIFRAPITITARTGYLNDAEAFYRRITGSYDLMETAVSPEDLLHVATTPPEFYVSESEGMTSILNLNERNETNVHKVEIINNILNRILLSADVGLTYQDRVFITDALYKLGIRDDRQFMSDFYRLAEETKNTNALINLYLDHAGELKEIHELRKDYDEWRETVTETTSETIESSELYLRIMDRLRTGAIYQIVSNFNQSGDNYRIDAGEYNMAPQTYTAKQLLLGRLREAAGTGSTELFYRSENRYEEAFYEGSVDETHVEQTLSAAVLMELAQNLYRVGFERFNTRIEAYYRFENSLYRSASEVLNRIRSTRNFDINASANAIRQIEVTNEMALREITLLDRIFESGTEDVYSELQRYFEMSDSNLKVLREQTSRQLENTREVIRKEETGGTPSISGVEMVYRETEIAEPGEEIEGELRQFTKLKEDTKEIHHEPGKTLLSSVIHEETVQGEENAEAEIPSVTIAFPDNILKQYEGDVYDLSQRSAKQQEFKENLYQQISEEYFAKEVSAPGISENGETSVELKHAESEDEERGEKSEPSESETYEEAESILRAVNELDIQNELRRQQLEQIIQQTDSARSPQLSPAEQLRRTREDAMLALRQPEVLKERLKEQENTEILRERSIMNEVRQILPPQGAGVWQIIEQYEQNPQMFLNNQTIRTAEAGELVRELNLIERQQQVTGEGETGEGGGASGSDYAGALRSQTRPLVRDSRPRTPAPVNTVHRQTQTITGEELEETIREMENRVNRQVKSIVNEEVTETTRVSTAQTQVISEVRQNEVEHVDIDRLVDAGVKRRMNAISDQVYRKLERRMQSEKIRRGY